MYAGGLLAEVAALRERGLGRTAATAIGYADADAYLRGACTCEEAVARTAARTWQLARRQMTWFRHQARVHWVDIERAMPAAEVAARVRAAWQETGPVRLSLLSAP